MFCEGFILDEGEFGGYFFIFLDVLLVFVRIGDGEIRFVFRDWDFKGK